ncbi:MAG: preprotein translocase subunit YajC [Candidatus Firestonebacteria bacterium]|nr:preprotein translocase subunit YajC [Candidatus Firestonebacteria bacterium]
MQTNTLVAMGGLPGNASKGTGGAAADPMAGMMSLLPLVLIFVLFYVLFILPQRRQQKQLQALLKALKKGDEVLTTGGIFGTIVGFSEKDNTVYLKLGENMKIEVQRSAIAGLRKPQLPADTK